MAMLVTSALLASPTVTNPPAGRAGSPKNLAAYKERASVTSGENGQSKNSLITKINAKSDNRAARLEKFLRSQGSPMAPAAQDLVKIADQYGLDYKLLPAIAGVESTYGLTIPTGSYNPYGWSNGNFYFGSWVAASSYVSSQINQRWGYMGKITPWKIGPYYAANPTWPSHVQRYMTLISNFK